MESKIKTSSNNSYLRKSQKPLYIDMGKRLRILRIELYTRTNGRNSRNEFSLLWKN